MFDAAAPELMFRLSIVLLPVLVLALLFTLLYYRQHKTVGEPADVHTLLHGTKPGGSGEPVNAESIFALEARISAADANAASTAEIYLMLGRARLAAGEEASALEALRSAAGLASRQGAADVHAQARIELAEAAVRAGDPTSACEHWQMARMAFLDHGNKDDGEKVDRRMRANGCPTDWVLTDF